MLEERDFEVVKFRAFSSEDVTGAAAVLLHPLLLLPLPLPYWVRSNRLRALLDRPSLFAHREPH